MSKSPKITIDQAGPALADTSPSAQLIKAAVLDEVLEDETGRKIRLKKPSTLAQFRLVAAVGADLASNQTYMQMINPLIYVAEIDGDAVFQPRSNLEVEALINRLGDEGIGVVLSWYMVNVMGATQDAIEAAQRSADEKAQLKN